MGAACAVPDDEDHEQVEQYITASGTGKNEQDLARLNTRAWLNDLSPDILALADEQANESRFKSLVPTENIVENLEWKIKYIKTLGSGATCRVILASMRDESEMNEIKSNNNENNNNNKNNSNHNRMKSNSTDSLDSDNSIENSMKAKMSPSSNNDSSDAVSPASMGSLSDILKGDKNNNKNKTQLFALKQLRKDDEDNINAFQREASILHKLDHGNIVAFETCYIDKYNFYIATKYCSGGPLLDFIVKCKYFSEQQASYYIKTILETIKYCHSMDIVHRDLKPENIMFDKKPMLHSDKNKLGFANDAKLIIIDFGEAKEVDDNAIYDEFVGTMMYLPPEITRFRHGWELKAGDVWSIGVIAYVLLTGKPPFLGADVKETIHIIGTQPLKWPSSKKIPLSRNCRTFVSRLLTKIPRTRATIDQALEHPWIAENEKNPNVGNTNLLKGELLTNIADFHHAAALKKILVNHLIAEMSRADKMLLIRGFRALDTDNSGTVSKKEVFNYLRKSGLDEANARMKAAEMMRTMDPENKGEISLKDYIRSRTLSKIETTIGSEEELIEKGMEYLDPQHTGHIDETILEKELGKSMSHEEKTKLMNSLKSKSKANLIDTNDVQMVLSSRSNSVSMEKKQKKKENGSGFKVTVDKAEDDNDNNNNNSNKNENNNGNNKPKLADNDSLLAPNLHDKASNQPSQTLEFDLDGLLHDLHETSSESEQE